MLAVWETIKKFVLEKAEIFVRDDGASLRRIVSTNCRANPTPRCDLPNHNSRNHPAWRFKAK